MNLNSPTQIRIDEATSSHIKKPDSLTIFNGFAAICDDFEAIFDDFGVILRQFRSDFAAIFDNFMAIFDGIATILRRFCMYKDYKKIILVKRCPVYHLGLVQVSNSNFVLKIEGGGGGVESPPPPPSFMASGD